MKLVATLLCLALIPACIYAGLALYAAGHKSARRECPPAQRGEKLLSTEQSTTGTVCVYSSGWNAYGRRIIRRRA